MHNKYLFTNVLGTFVFNEHFNLIDKVLFNNKEQFLKKDTFEKELQEKYTNIKLPEGKELSKILGYFKKKDYFGGFREANIELSKEAIREAVKEDLLIIQTINAMDELDKCINILIKRLREWYGLYNPEFEREEENQERFVTTILSKKDKKEKESMGGKAKKEDMEHIMVLSHQIKELFDLRKKQQEYLESLMKEVAPNVQAIAGANIGARLLEQAGGLKKMMEMPASTIQLLGAEKALFRHMKTGARAPKFGFLHEHPLILKQPRQMHGKIARALADKISIAVKVDYFKGKFLGDKLLKDLEKKFR